jgi:hypothetical protein
MEIRQRGHVWGSPIGAGIFFVCVAATIALLRYAFWS